MDLSGNIILVIIITSLATFLSRFLGVLSSKNINIRSKIFRWFNCIAYAILASLIARMIIYPAGILSESDNIIIDRLQSGYFGFPAEIPEDPILFLVKNFDPNEMEDAEERRYFYVALTRAKKKM